MFTSAAAINNLFAGLVVNDEEEFRRYLRINTASYHFFFLACRCTVRSEAIFGK